ncbi:hypothetical protein [Singulisphaera sp. PoT]|uniref:hypothetical protein n=1 Tax=Singulisphaera sp. PoT TaxID=3411797 RepID=UPI003BF535FA
MWLTLLIACSLAVTGTGFAITARLTIRASRCLRESPEDRVARFDYGWLGAFALMCGISCAMSLAVLINSHVQSRWLVVVGLFLLNVLI